MSESRHVTELHNTKRGKTCNLVAHGISMRQDELPEFLGEETICVNNWIIDPDYLLFVDTFIRDFILRMGRTRIGIPGHTKIVTSDRCKMVADYYFKISEYPLARISRGSYRNGVRGLWMATQMGYDKIYLYGYDFIKVDEDRHQGDAHLRKYLDQFTQFNWPSRRIVQTNPESKLQF